MGSPLEDVSPPLREKLVAKKQPGWTQPMLATLTESPFSDPGWIFERKLDGVRCLAFRSGGKVRLLSRNRKPQNRTYPELAAAFEKERARDFIADGEIVAFEGARTSFSRLQERIGITDPEKALRTGVAVYIYVFDLLYLDGHDLCRLPLRSRKALLKKAFSFEDPIRYSRHRNEEGEAFFEDACRKGWEGLIAKEADAPYEHRRSRKWLKFKCVCRQEFVIVGYTPPQGSRVGLGALLIGYYEDGSLRYAGKVGTGYDERTLRRLRAKLERIERKSSPLDEKAVGVKDARWVTPRLVGEVVFTEWTGDGKLRHPRFAGIREDKEAEEVVRERPAR